MQKSTMKKARSARLPGSSALAAASVILALSPVYAQAGYGTTALVKATPTMQATLIGSKRISGSSIAYETPMMGAGNGMQPVVIQGAGAPGSAPNVEGFADQVPLKVAMQQVLPQGMGYTLADNVNPGQLVSWRGGRPWQTVLQDMLAPSGLGYNTNGSSVMVSASGGAPAVIGGYPQAGSPMTPSPMMQAYAAPQGYAAQAYAPQAPSMPPQAMMTPAATLPTAVAPPYDATYAAPPPYQPGGTYGASAMMQPQGYPPQGYGQQAYAPQAPMIPPPPATAPYAVQPDPQQQMFVPAPPQQQATAPQGMPAPMPQQGMPPMAQGSPQQASAAAQPLQIQNPALFQSQSWEAKPGQTLRVILQDWCQRAGAELNWQAEYDYPVMASMTMTGTFEEAVRTLLAGFDSAKPVPYGRLHYNPAAGQSILIVEASGNHYGD